MDGSADHGAGAFCVRASVAEYYWTISRVGVGSQAYQRYQASVWEIEVINIQVVWDAGINDLFKQVLYYLEKMRIEILFI